MLLYITVIVKPIFPIVSDWYEHEFNSIQHEFKVHKVYGNHHLDKEIADSNSEEEHNKNSNSVKSEDSVPFHIILEDYKYLIYSAIINKVFTSCFLSELSSVFLSLEGPPPKLI